MTTLNTLWLPEPRYTSQYNLINDFILQLQMAAQRAGLPVNVEPASADGFLRPAAIYFNHAPKFPEKAREAAMLAGPHRCAAPPVLHWLIDHPLSLRHDVWSAVEKLPGYRLMTVSDDDAQLISLHYPGIRQARCWHGVDESSLCDAAAIEASHKEGGARDIDVLVAGTVQSEEALAQRKNELPASLRAVCDSVADLRCSFPWMGFTQAYELSAPNGLHSATHWDLLHAVFVCSTGMVNTRRRLSLLRSLDGLRVTVIGRGPWETIARPGLTVVPEVAYAELPAWISRARVSLALNPTQFVHGFSERLLLSLAGGAASVTDDRLWVRREFADCTARFDAAQPESCRAAVESILADRDRAAAMGSTGRARVQAGHLWRHRLGAIALLASNAGRELGWGNTLPSSVAV